MTPTDELRKAYEEGVVAFRDQESDQAQLMLTGLTALYLLDLCERQDRTNELLQRLVAAIDAEVDDGK